MFKEREVERTGQIEEGRAGQRVPVPQGQALAGLDDEGARGPQRRGRTGCRRGGGDLAGTLRAPGRGQGKPRKAKMVKKCSRPVGWRTSEAACGPSPPRKRISG